MENVEAMLCAYIEGELDPASRAEIERHLRDNPQHRKLLAELMSLRAVLRDLPRIPAPPEVSTGVRENAERAMLLGDDQPLPMPGRPGSRWRQYAAIAAVFLLTTGVGIIVYRAILPPLKPANFAEVTPSNDEENAAPPEQSAAAPTATPDTTQPVLAMAQPVAPVAATAVDQALANTTPTTLSDREMRAIQDELQHSNPGNRMASNVGPGTNAGNFNNLVPAPVYSYWVVDGSAPADTHAKINSFLNSNNLAYTPLSRDFADAAKVAPTLTLNGASTGGGIDAAGAVLPAKTVFTFQALSPTTNPATQPQTVVLTESPISPPAPVLPAAPVNAPAGYLVHGITQKQLEQLDDSLQTPNAPSAKHLYRVLFDDKSAAQLEAAQRPVPLQQQQSQSQVGQGNLRQAQADVPPAAADAPVEAVILVRPPPAAVTTAPSPATTQPTTQPAAP